jgi:hypothetical protein
MTPHSTDLRNILVAIQKLDGPDLNELLSIIGDGLEAEVREDKGDPEEWDKFTTGGFFWIDWLEAATEGGNPYTKAVAGDYPWREPRSAAEIPDGLVLVHNPVIPAPMQACRGFRFFLKAADEGSQLCNCGWAPQAGPHYHGPARKPASLGAQDKPKRHKPRPAQPTPRFYSGDGG